MFGKISQLHHVAFRQVSIDKFLVVILDGKNPHVCRIEYFHVVAGNFKHWGQFIRLRFGAVIAILVILKIFSSFDLFIFYVVILLSFVFL